MLILGKGGGVGEGGNRRVSKRKKLGTKPVSIEVLFSLLLFLPS